MRGNVHTRVERLLAPDSPCDALVLAEAGLLRLGLGRVISERLSRTDMLPAPGQGALALQCRAEAELLRLLAPLDHAPTRAAVTAERAFLAARWRRVAARRWRLMLRSVATSYDCAPAC